MRIGNVKTAILAAHSAQRALMLWGKPGVGKSAAVREAAWDLGRKHGKPGGRVLEYGNEAPKDADGNSLVKACIGLHDVRVSQCDLVEIGGLVNKSDHDTMDRLVPDWWPHVDRDDLPDYGIVFLDELPSGARSTMAAAYQLMQDRVCAGKRLKPGWSIMGAGNRLTDGGVVNPMPTPLANRLIHVEVESNAEDWEAWAWKAGLQMEVIAFIRFKPDLLNTFEEHVTKKLEGHAFATERSWHATNDLVANNALPRDVLHEMVLGTVGKGPATEFMAFLDVWKDMVDPAEILADPTNAPLPEKTSAQIAVSTALAAKATPNNMDAVVTYFERMPPSMSMFGIKDVQRRDRSCCKTQAYLKWANDNAEVLQ